MNPIYLDNHATTRVDPRVAQVMLQVMTECYGNAGSVTHTWGRQARELVEQSRAQIAAAIHAKPAELIFTSGATESNNLALLGVAGHPRNQRRRIVSVVTEHRAVLDPLNRLARQGFDVQLLPVQTHGNRDAGRVRLADFKRAVDANTLLVSVMLANNEIGVLQPVSEISAIARARGAWFHCDATQAVGKLPVDVERLGVDLMSFSAHKLHGPKGIGALYVRRGAEAPRLVAQLFGGGQEMGLRSGTLNVPGIVGFAEALRLCLADLVLEPFRVAGLRDRLFERLNSLSGGVILNGPELRPDLRLAHNLNVQFPHVDGQTLMATEPDLGLSSGSACSAAHPQPSHVLRGLGLNEDEIRQSLRFGLGRFTTEEEIELAAHRLSQAVQRLRPKTYLPCP